MRTVTADGVAAIVTRNVMVYRHTWALLLAEILEPILYLGSVGLGIGELVGRVPGLGSVHVGYAEFVAPALLATAAMNGSMNETTFLMYGRLAIERIYQPILATPLGVAEIALGEALWAVLRGTAVTAAFLSVIAVLGLVHSPWVLLALPGAALIGFAFASAGVVVVTYLRGFADMQYIQLVMLPMFLFATTFYPLNVYPRPVQLAVECLPLYQSIELLRRPALGRVDAQLLVPVSYLLLMGLIASWWALRRMRQVLVQ
jgi:lipooligosaccharide transport system permease protein